MFRISKLNTTSTFLLCLLTAALPGVAQTQNSDALSLLLEQNQQLRNELQALRGMVEEQSFQIRRLQRDSLNRYTDMDQRLQALEGSPATAAPTTPSGEGGDEIASSRGADGAGIDGNVSDINSNTGNVGFSDRNASVSSGLSSRALNATTDQRGSQRPANRGTLEPAVLSEQQLYQMAYDSVINSNFERSLSEFDQYLSVYPEGRFVTNAHYWKGQAYLYLERYGQARQSYEIILDQYPDSAKLPDAMYGLALAFQGMDNTMQARELLNQIKRQFPNTGVANLADTRLLTLD